MKKILATILAVLMIAAMAVPAFAANDGYKVELKKNYVDILDGKKIALINYNKDQGKYVKSNSSSATVTDGIYAYDPITSGSTPRADYLGYWCTNTAKANEIIAAPTLTFAGIEGQKYLYGIEISGITGDNYVTEFALYTNKTSATANYDDGMDGAFQILVSTDNGTTYQKAWSSKTSNSNKTVADGGDWTEVEVKDGDKVVYKYRYINAKFTKAFENVTNVVYACTTSRVADSTSTSAYKYIAASISEFDVYSTPKTDSGNTGSDSTGDSSMIVAMILVGAVALTGSAVVIRKRREEV